MEERIKNIEENLSWVKREIFALEKAKDTLKFDVNSLLRQAQDIREQISRLQETVGALNLRTAGMIKIGGNMGGDNEF